MNKIIQTKSIFKAFLLSCLSLSLNAQNINLQWVKQFAGAGEEYGTSIALDALGNVYTIGDFTDTVDFDPSSGIYNLSEAGTRDVFISKLDPLGNFVWAKRVGGATLDNGHSICIDVSGNIYVMGSFFGTSDFDPGPNTFNLSASGFGNVFILKLDTAGNFVWAKQLGTDYGYAMTLDLNNNIFITGSFNYTADMDPGSSIYTFDAGSSSDIFVSKLDSFGNFVWAKQIECTGSSSNGQSIKLDTLGNIYVTGVFRDTADFDPSNGIFNAISTGSSADPYILKLDSTGNFVWVDQLVGDGSGRSLSIDAIGDVLITGSFSYTMDFDPGPAIYNFTSAGNIDVFILKLNSSGNFLWAKQIGDDDDDDGNFLSLDNLGNIYITGYFSHTVDFNPGLGTYYQTAAGLDNLFILKLDTQGNFVWATGLGGLGYSEGNSVIVDVFQNVYTTGYFENVANFNPQTGGVYNLTSAGDEDVFVHKMGQVPLGITEDNLQTLISIYPNPTNNNIIIVADKQFINEPIQFIFSNVLGEILQKQELTEPKSRVGLNFPKGIYLITLKSSQKSIIKKIVLQ